MVPVKYLRDKPRGTRLVPPVEDELLESAEGPAYDEDMESFSTPDNSYPYRAFGGRMDDRSCPQCNVAMEETAVTAEGVGDLYVATERDDGVLKRLGIGENTALDAFLCPECGLTQLYADLDT